MRVLTRENEKKGEKQQAWEQESGQKKIRKEAEERRERRTSGTGKGGAPAKTPHLHRQSEDQRDSLPCSSSLSSLLTGRCWGCFSSCPVGEERGEGEEEEAGEEEHDPGFKKGFVRWTVDGGLPAGGSVGKVFSPPFGVTRAWWGGVEKGADCSAVRRVRKKRRRSRAAGGGCE